MSASTQGTPEWLLRLEAAQVQLKPDNYLYWLKTKAVEYGVPDDVIKSQMERIIGVPTPEEAKELLTLLQDNDVKATTDLTGTALLMKENMKQESDTGREEAQGKVPYQPVKRRNKKDKAE